PYELLAPLPGLHRPAALLVLVRVLLRVRHHALDLRLGTTPGRFDPDLLLLPGRLVARRAVQNAVRVDVERHLDLRHPARRGRKSGELEPPDGLVVGRQRPLALK